MRLISIIFIGTEFDSAQSVAEQVLCQTAAFQGRARQGRLLEAGSRKNGGEQTVQTSLRDLAANSQLQEAILIGGKHDDDDSGNSNGDDDNDDGNDDAQCTSEQLLATHQLFIQHSIRDPA